MRQTNEENNYKYSLNKKKQKKLTKNSSTKDKEIYIQQKKE